jgi:transmembrane sensor
MSQGDDAERGDLNRREEPTLDPLRDEALRWFVELRAAEGDRDVRRAFDAWLARDRRHAAAFAEVARLWNSPEFGRALAGHERATVPDGGRGEPAAPAARRPHRPNSGFKSRSWVRSIVAVAAILLLAAATAHYSGLLLYLQADYVTATGQQRRVSLPDGSTVLLNSGSAIALDFGGGRRVVQLIAGEAFFEVARNPNRPFQVVGPVANIEVTGTAFSVRAMGERDNVTLQHGSVVVRPRKGQLGGVKLAPRHAVAVGASGAGDASVIDPNDAFAWLEGRIRFRDRPLGDVLDELRRYHRGIIIVANGRIGELRVSGNYRLDDPALVVASLAEAVGATLTRLSDHVLILR